MISGSMPLEQVIKHLVHHGCPNISTHLDLSLCNETAISRGGFGDVYQGRLLDGTKIAIKCLRLYVDTGEDNQKALKYAARELYTWSKCKHPNVIKLLGLAEFRGQIAMVSPWIESGNVSSLNKANHTIDRCLLCVQIAEGLAYLHQIGIVHGDLKGANVLLSDGRVAQLADFGNALMRSSTLDFTESTTRSQLSTRWAAPEQLDGLVSCSLHADVFSLGMTILEVISRRQPYCHTKKDIAVITTILVKRQHPQRPEDTIPTASKQGNTLWSLLERCWSWEPEDRPDASRVTTEYMIMDSLLTYCSDEDNQPRRTVR
ncbi:hypothetical protein FRC12_017436 [Ceratobasidium sp. 428]|nr:hypothetical protein FRC12_017436 [Ceratobasidium sp. 428]